MMQTIWKYEIPVKDVFTIEMPRGSKVLHVGTQKGVPHIWVEVPLTESEKVTHRYLFYLLGTGNIALELAGLEYVGSFLIKDDELVFHLYQNANI